MRGLLLQALLQASTLKNDILLPKYQTPYDVTIRTTELDDRSRIDQDDPNKGFRRLMISVFSPVQHVNPQCTSKDILDAPANAFSAFVHDFTNVSMEFKRFVLPYCSYDVTYGSPAQKDESQRKPEKFPVVFFSPGLTVSRFVYNTMNAALVSSGFIVVSVDHPYSVDVVQYPDNTTAVMQDLDNIDKGYLNRTLAIRTDDILFTLDQLTQNSTLYKLVFPGSKPLSLKSVGIWGHSFGGATAAAANFEDDRFKGGLDLDGGLFGPVVDHGLSKPFILWQQEAGHNRTSDPSWATVWPRLRGFRRNLALAKSAHLAFSDLRVQADLYGLRNSESLAAYVGAIDGKRAVEVLRAYAADYFNFVLLGKKKVLMDKPSGQYPEVTFIP